MNKKAERAIEALRENRFEAVYFETAAEAKDYLLAETGDRSVGFGGSVTLDDMGIYQALKERGNEVYWHWYPEEGCDRLGMMKKAMTTDVYMSGVNGLTEDGRIINIDGTGNRLSSLLFGHDRLFLVCGVNKISRNLEESMIRIKNIACPLNTQRLDIPTPCNKAGKCMACNAERKICNATLVMEAQHGGIPTTVVIIGENLGF